MQKFNNFISLHFERILILMIILAVIFIVFWPTNTMSIWIFALLWTGGLILMSLILRQTNLKLKDYEETLHTTMDPAVIRLMIAKNLRTENRPISVQFTDLKDFTGYAEEKSTEVVLSELNTYLREMETVLLEYNAHIDKYMGDGIMSEFGAPNTYIKHSLLAVASGWAMQKTMKLNHFPWPLRVGISTGVSTIGIIGTKRQAYTAFGDVVNLASRIEGLCEPGRVTVDEATYLECKDYFNFKQKSFSMFNQLENEELTHLIEIAQAAHEKDPLDLSLIMNLASLLLQAHDTKKALEYLNTAMTLNPQNDEVKIAYANASMEHNEQIKLEVRGRKQPIQVYELTGLKCPLNNFKTIPEKLYTTLKPQIEELVPFPEKITLPIESLDGSIGQARLVGIVSYLIAEKLGLPLDMKKNILEAGYLADIGKLTVPESVLNRPGQLNESETKFIHGHPQASVRMLKEAGYTNQALINIVACHHESIDGRGYPSGLVGTDIPIGSRILAVAEAYVSMTSNRPYRDAWEVKPAYQEILKYSERGKFDLEVAKVLGEIISVL